MMKIINTGSVRIRIEGYGYAAPGKSITVPDDTGRNLCVEGSVFKEVQPPKPLSEITKPPEEVKKKRKGTKAQRHRDTK